MKKVSQPRHDVIIDKDVEIPMRGGVRLRADVYRPRRGGKVPAIINIGAYQKDKLWVPPADLEEKPNPYMNWETVNPLWWVPRGYAAVRVDTRGSGKSPGQTDPFSLQEAIDFYDSIEWSARQSWCNGRVGSNGISYFAMTQWLVANLRPPSLKAMIPWEGAADMYRDFSYHGGIFCFGFITNWYNNHMAHHLLGRREQASPDAFSKHWLWDYMRNSLESDHYHGRQARWDDITVPFYSAGNWSGMALHLRGNTEAYLRARTPHKKLRIQAGTHYHPFYAEEARHDQLRFFDYWLKGVDTEIMDEPPVKLLIRTGGNKNYRWRNEQEWPLARTRWTEFYLQPARRMRRGNSVEGVLATTAPKARGSLTYSASAVTKAGVASASWTSTALAGSLPRLGVSFETEPMREDLEVTGPVVLTLWVSSTTDDMDVFATIRNIDPDGNDVWEVGQQQQPVPVAKGWLRASHRKLDPELSLPFRPYHAHNERQWLKQNQPVRLDVEIWPTCMVFRKGHRLRLDIQPRDGVGSAPYTHYSADYNTGENTIHTGGSMASHLLLPIIPQR
ncbi:MAG: CocE/NonD family hydrolase [Betaproteobacteria bacterium]|nr:CocE/NonD family hydrolase [Betaproteobacteria bacterium]MDH3438150.1 CocE/NonD family hydrolase [Betaproteobacteria bacterium]